MVSKRSNRAFTLVELLVVIGIIGVLISILLPALQKARQQANLLACESNLHEVGVSVGIYQAENHGYFPYGHAQMARNPQSDNYGQNVGTTAVWDWPDSLTRLNRPGIPSATTYPPGQPTWARGASPPFPAKNLQNMAADYLPIFHDYDGIQLPYDTRISDFIANIRLFPDITVPEPTTGTGLSASTKGLGAVWLPLRQAAGVQRSSETMAIWCGVQWVYGTFLGYNDYADGPTSYCLDSGQMEFGPYPNAYWMLFPGGTIGSTFTAYNNLITINNNGVLSAASPRPNLDALVRSKLPGENVDLGNGLSILSQSVLATNAMRFRHLNNTTCNIMFADGHVELRKLGTVTAKDVSVNYAPPGTGAP